MGEQGLDGVALLESFREPERLISGLPDGVISHEATIDAIDYLASNKYCVLYQTTVITELAEDRRYGVPGSTVLVFPFTIDAEQSKRIILFHTDITQQDHSLRSWVSREVAGTEILMYPLELSIWHPNRVPHHVVTVYDKDMDEPEGVALLPVEPGEYFLHVLNLTNRQNSFAYFLDVTTP